MDYLILIHGSEARWAALPAAEQAGLMAAYTAYAEALAAAGALRAGHRLAPAASASLVRGAQVLDGPYAETGEQLGGYYLVEAADAAAALDWARRCPGARHGTVELRAIFAPAPRA